MKERRMRRKGTERKENEKKRDRVEGEWEEKGQRGRRMGRKSTEKKNYKKEKEE